MSMIIRPLSNVILMAVLIVGCDTSVQDAVSIEEQRISESKTDACDNGECPCETPVGTVLHGASVTIYSQAQVTCEESCQEYAKPLYCDNGALKNKMGDEASEEDLQSLLQGQFFACRVKDCEPCVVGENLIQHQDSFTFYSQPEADCNQSCDEIKQVRRCNNGVLEGDSSYSFAACLPRECRCRLPDDTGYLSLGGQMNFYNTQQASCGTQCLDFEQTRTCTSTGSGSSRSFSFDGSPSHSHQSCNEATNCFCTLPQGGVLAHLESTKLNTISKALCGQSCQVDGAEIDVQCQNGDLVNLSDNSIVEPQTTSYKHQCVQETCSLCPVDANTQIPHGQTYDFYSQKSPSCGATCDSIKKTLTCNNGTFSGQGNFNHSSCQERECRCQIPRKPNQYLPVGQSQIFYSSDKSTCTGVCSDIELTRTCQEIDLGGGNFDYKLSGNYNFKYSSCGAPTNCDCALPNGLPNILNGKTTTLHSQATVACGKVCADVPAIQVTCKNGQLHDFNTDQLVDILAPGLPFKHQCQPTLTCVDCFLPGYGTIQNGLPDIVLYIKDRYDCDEKVELLQYTFRCDSGQIYRNGNPYNPSSDNQAPAQYHTAITSDCAGCKTPWGVTIGEGATTTGYHVANAIGGCGKGCKSQEMKCENGVLLGDTVYFNKGSCGNTCAEEGGGAPPRLCLLPWQNSYVTPGAKIPMWKRSTVPCGESCYDHYAVGTCQLETGTFDVGSQYIYKSCTELCY